MHQHRFAIAVLLLLFSALPAFARKDYNLYFDARTFTPPENTSAQAAWAEEEESRLCEGHYFRIVQFYDVPSEADRQAIGAAGIKFIGYIPNLAYYLAIPAGADLSVLAARGARSVTGVDADLKIHRALSAGSVPAHALREDGKAAFVLSYFSNLSWAFVEKALAGRSIIIEDHDGAAFIATIIADVSRIGEMAAWPFTAFLEPTPEPDKTENRTGTTLHRVNGLQQLWSGGRYYDGTGVTVNVGDADLMDAEHIDFQGRLAGAGSSGATHATHVGGIAGSAGNLNPLSRGQASGADIRSSTGHGDVSSNLATLYNTYGVRVTNHSLGQGCNDGYNASARTADLAVSSYEAIYHVFSAGNSGTSDCSLGAGAGWGNITGGYKAAKNTIAVGNLGQTDGISSSSSRGPTPDARIKPDICAKGSSVFSTYPDNTYSSISGTSMASPGVAGCVAALIQAYRSLNGGQDPKTGLLKGVLLNTTDDLGNAGPDYIYGWGRINALRAVRTLEEQRYVSGMLANGQNASHVLTVPAGTAQLRVMVYWLDPAATAGVSIALINDIDLTVTTPSSQTFDAWTLSTNTSSASALSQPATRGKDRRNNMEQVTIDNPAAGTYTVNLSGYQVPQGPQEYFVTYEFIADAIEVIHPNGGEGLVPGETEYIRWDAWGSTGNFTAEYSLNEGQNWSVISSSVAGTRRYQTWTVPSPVSGRVRVRVSRSGKSDVSDTNATIIGVPPNIRIDKRCSSAFVLAWDAVSGATGYEVYRLGQKYMESQGTTTALEFTMPGSSTQTDWVSVRALGPDNAKGRRAIAVQKTTGTNSTACVNNAPPVAQFSTKPGCSGLAFFTDESQNTVTSWIWDFGDGNTSNLQNPTHTYTADGNYTVSLTVSGPNGTDSVVKISEVSVVLPEVTSVTGAQACAPASVTLSAAGKGTLNWYDSPGGSLTGSGTTFTTPVLSTATSYFVTSSVQNPPVSAGPSDNTFGAGGNFTASDAHGLIFDATAPFRLKSVKVYAGAAGSRTIEVLDAQGGNVVHTTTANIPSGESRVTLNFDIQPAAGYFIKVTGSLVDLYRNSSGPSYPYVIPGLLSIVQSSASTPTAYYYYFYDWEVEQNCVSQPAVEVVATLHPQPAQPVITLISPLLVTDSSFAAYQWYLDGNAIGGATVYSHLPVQNGSYTVEVTDSNGCTNVSDPYLITDTQEGVTAALELEVYPNPSDGRFLLRLTNVQGEVSVSVYNTAGQMVVRRKATGWNGEYSEMIDLGTQAPGIYQFTVVTATAALSRRLVNR